MHTNVNVQLVVEAPDERVRLIRVSGRFDRAAAASLLRLVDVQLAQLAAGRYKTTVLIIDLDGVSSFEHGGLESMRHAPHQAATRGVVLCLSGCSARFHLLPLRVAQLLGEFRRFPTVDVALAALTSRDSAPSSAERAGRLGPDAEQGDPSRQTVDGPGALAARRYGPSTPPPPSSAVAAPRSTHPAEAVSSVDPTPRQEALALEDEGSRLETGCR